MPWWRWWMVTGIMVVLWSLALLLPPSTADAPPEEPTRTGPREKASCKNWKVVSTAVHGDYPANSPIEVRRKINSTWVEMMIYPLRD